MSRSRSGFLREQVLDGIAARSKRVVIKVVSALRPSEESTEPRKGRVAFPVAKACFQHWHPVGDESDDDRLRAVNAEVSPDLGIVIASHYSDKIATVDYEVTNIRRDEPPADLFEVPTDYTRATGSRDDPLVTFAPWQSPPACRPLTR